MTSHRWALYVVLVGAFSLPLVGLGMRAALQSNANDVRDWLPAHYIETRDYRWFCEQFGSEDFVVISWPGCTLDNPELDRLAERLHQRSELHQLREGETLFRRVTTGAKLARELTAEPFALDRNTVISRLQGTVVGPDGQLTCALVTLSDEARGNLHRALDEIRAAAADIGLAAHDIYLGGPPVVNAAIDDATSQTLVRLMGLAALVGLVVAWLCFRSVRLTAIVFIVAGYSAGLSLALVPAWGVPLNAILITMVPMVYVSAMSGAIHLSNYYLDSLRAGQPAKAISRAIRHAALPLGLATSTTAIGLLSLWYSDLNPIRLFGLFSALGVGISLALQLVLSPALLTLWPAPQMPDLPPPTPEGVADLHAEPLPAIWQRLASLVIDWQAWVAGSCLVLLALGVFGLTRVETSIQMMRLFSRTAPVVESYAWLEKNLGALVPMEIVIRFDKNNSLTMLRRLQLVRELQRGILEVPHVTGCISAATFAPEIRSSGVSVRTVLANRRLTRARPRLVEAGYLAGNDEEELWRISVRVLAGEDLDYGLFQPQLASRVEPILATANAEESGLISAVFTGSIPIIYKARRSLLNGMLLGFGTDVLLVVAAVVILLRHWSYGALLLLTSVFPMALVFGFMGWLGIVVDIGSVMTPCVALGVTIDDVIHFVLWFRRGIERGLPVPAAVQLAYAGCGRAMVQSWGVIGLGLSVFSLSTFATTFRFGALMIGLLTVGLVGNLLFLPALLASPLGHWMAANMRGGLARKTDVENGKVKYQ